MAFMGGAITNPDPKRDYLFEADASCDRALVVVASESLAAVGVVASGKFLLVSAFLFRETPLGNPKIFSHHLVSNSSL